MTDDEHVYNYFVKIKIKGEPGNNSYQTPNLNSYKKCIFQLDIANDFFYKKFLK